MNKGSSKKIINDSGFAGYLIPAELARFTQDIINLTTYLEGWAEVTKGGKRLIDQLQTVITGMEQAQKVASSVLKPKALKAKAETVEEQQT